jgi:hypothetical protein
MPKVFDPDYMSSERFIDLRSFTGNVRMYIVNSRREPVTGGHILSIASDGSILLWEVDPVEAQAVGLKLDEDNRVVVGDGHEA